MMRGRLREVGSFGRFFEDALFYRLGAELLRLRGLDVLLFWLDKALLIVIGVVFVGVPRTQALGMHPDALREIEFLLLGKVLAFVLFDKMNRIFRLIELNTFFWAKLGGRVGDEFDLDTLMSVGDEGFSRLLEIVKGFALLVFGDGCISFELLICFYLIELRRLLEILLEKIEPGPLGFARR